MQVDLEELISAHSDSHVNQSAKQESKKETQMTGGSGMKLLEYYKLANRNGSLLKMLKVLLPSKTAFCSNIVSLVWKMKVTKYNRLLFQLVPKTHHIDETEFGSSDSLWPTPRASDVEGGIAKDVQSANGRFFRQNEKGEKWGVKLRDAVNYTEKTKLLPTPTTRDYKDTGNIDKWNENMDRDSLPRRIFHMEKKKFWPTPAASDNRDRGNLSNPSVQRRIKLGKQVGLTMAVKEENTMGTLNSEWVTWLMGYPEGYLDISTENQTISQELQKEKKIVPKS